MSKHILFLLINIILLISHVVCDTAPVTDLNADEVIPLSATSPSSSSNTNTNTPSTSPSSPSSSSSQSSSSSSSPIPRYLNSSAIPAPYTFPANTSIWVGISTIPPRFNKGLLHRAVKSLLEQSHPIEKIVVAMPSVDKDGSPVSYNEELVSSLNALDPSKVVIAALDKDWGPICKLMGVLSMAPKHAYLFLTDDDRVYNKHVLMTQILGWKKFAAQQKREDPRFHLHAVGYSGRSGPNFEHIQFLSNSKPVDMVANFCGGLYPASAFDWDSLVSFINAQPGVCFYNDDIVMSAYLSNTDPWGRRVVLSHHIISPNQNIVCEDISSDTPKLWVTNIGGGRNMVIWSHFVQQHIVHLLEQEQQEIEKVDAEMKEAQLETQQ